MSAVNKNQLVTLADLEEFKTQLTTVFKELVKTSQGPKKWLKSSEVRKLTGISPGKLQVIRESGLLAFTRIGGNIYYDPEDVHRLFEENKVIKSGK